MKKQVLILSFIAVFISSTISAQDLYRLTLSTAVELAKKQNTSIRNAKYDINIARKQVWETTAQGLPQMSTKLSYSNNLDLPVTLVPAKMFNPNAADGEFIELKFGVQHNVQFNFQITQLVFNGSYIVGLQTAKTFKQLSEQNFQLAESEVVKTITESYNTLLFSLKNRRALEATLVDVQQTYQELKKTFEAGLAEETSVDQLLLNALTVENAIKNIDRQIKVQHDLLKIQMGVDLKDSIIITDSLDLVFDNSSFQQSIAVNFDLTKNVNYQLMLTQEEINLQQLRLEKSTLLPSINAFYTHNQSGQSDDFTFFQSDQRWFPSNIIGASLVIPITTSGGTLARISQAELELQKTKNNRFLLEQNLMMGAQTAKNKLITEYESYNTQKQNLELAEKIYKRALVQFKQGMISSSELTQLNTQFYNIQSAYFAAMLNVLNAQAELDNILGTN